MGIVSYQGLIYIVGGCTHSRRHMQVIIIIMIIMIIMIMLMLTHDYPGDAPMMMMITP